MDNMESGSQETLLLAATIVDAVVVMLLTRVVLNVMGVA